MKHRSQHGGVLTAILLGLCLTAALAIVALVSAGMFLAHNVRVSSSDDKVSVETPFGSVRVRERARVDPRHFGVPVYPGAARRHDSKAASVELDLGDEHQDFSIIAAEFTTPDSADKVRDFYRQRLPGWMITEKRRGCFQIESGKGASRRFVCIRERGGLTHIALASIGDAAAN